ncbi:MAG: hypothetical protein J5959_10990 [Butyrivibrio sp.]|nr:hypothetical protein [Butyrivibrio sp.]
MKNRPLIAPNIMIITLGLMLSAAGCGKAAPTIEAESRVVQDYSEATVSFLGPEGTYTQEACGVFFNKQGSYEPYETVSDAVDALESGASEYAVIPQENTIGGAVTDYVDIVIAHDSLSVVGEVELPINQNLLVLPGAKLEDIQTVFSHKQGIAQGKEWIEKNIPDAEVIEVSSTAEGAKMVSESDDKTVAAIASAACADVYHLELLASAIQENDNNKPDFMCFQKICHLLRRPRGLRLLHRAQPKIWRLL